MAKRKKLQPEDRLAKIIKIIKPAYDYEAIKILKAVAIMQSLPDFSHEQE